MAGFRHRFARIGATNPPLTPPRRGTDSARFGLDAPATGAVHTVALQQLGDARAGEAPKKPCNPDVADVVIKGRTNSTVNYTPMKNASTLLILGLLTAGWSVLAAEKKIDLSKIDVSKLPPPADKKGLTYAKDIRPLFEASCFRCHGEEKQKGELRLDSLEAVLKGGEDGKVIVPGASKKSLLVIAASRIDDETAMPPKPKPGGPGGQFGGPGGPGARGGPGNRPPGGPGGPQGNRPPGERAGPGAGPGGFGPPPKPLTPDQVGLIRAWVDQGAK